MRIKLARLALFAAIAMGSPAAAQRVNPDRVVDLHINLEAQNQSFGGSVREGTRFNLSIRGEGEFALVPVVTDEGRRQLTISVLRVEGENARTLETVTATIGQPAVLRAIRSTTVVVERLRIAPRPSASAGAASFAGTGATRRFGAGWFGKCCVTCGNVTACACAVSMDCGSCCADACCPIVDETRGPGAAAEGRTFAQRAVNSCTRPIPVGERRFVGAPAPGARVASSR